MDYVKKQNNKKINQITQKKTMKKNLLTVLICCGLLSCTQQYESADYRVVPLPQEITLNEEADGFELNLNTSIAYPAGDETMQRNAAFLAEYIKEKCGLELQTTDEQKKKNTILLSTSYSSENKEAYELTVTDDKVTINGASPAGVFYGIQTLRKALPVASDNILLPAVVINDAPRFPYRGAHFDVSRHFFTVDSVKRFIDMLALHNINRFHWHLTDDQGWRIEIKKYPELTTISSYRPETVIGRNTDKYDGIPHDGSYTQEECREIVKYAAERHITVIPEIDLPGHMQAALAAYPHLGCTGGPYEVWKMWGVSENVLCAGNDQTLRFIEDILNEVIDIFPSEYIHVGGDECPKTRWEKCPKCQARIKDLGLKDDAKHSAEMYLQSYIISHAEKFLNSKGRQIIGWDEILEGGLAPNATVHSWRGIEGAIAAARQGHNSIMSPTTFMYFDYYQSKDTEHEPLAIGGYVPVEKVYSFEPIPDVLTPEERKHIIGVQANLWTEYVPTYKHVEYMELPRMAALCEVQWTMPEKKNYDDFKQRLAGLVKMYDIKEYNYAKHLFDVEVAFAPDNENKAIVATLSTIDNAPVYYTTDGSEPTTSSKRYTEPVAITENCTFTAKAIRATGESRSISEEISFNKATAKTITMLQPINKPYSFNGAGTLVDGLKGNMNYKTGRWIGFYRNDMEAVIDLDKTMHINSVTLHTCVEKGDWIFDARGFIVSVSNDGENYTEVFNEAYEPMKESDPNQIYKHALPFPETEARYVKIKALVEHNIPQWHGGRGNCGFLFVDEIIIE